jgi:hypothetical protein
MITCIKCPPDRNRHSRGVIYLRGDVFVEFCKVHDPASRRALVAARNVFEGGFVMENVRDERGHKPVANSLAELRALEKKHNVAMAVFADDGGRADKPPQHEKWSGRIDHGKQRVWNRDPAAYESFDSISTGNAADPRKDTLVDRPNATHVD